MLDQAQANVAVMIGEEAELGQAAADTGYWPEANVSGRQGNASCSSPRARTREPLQRRTVGSHAAGPVIVLSPPSPVGLRVQA